MLDLSAWHFIAQHRLCSLPELREWILGSHLWAPTPGSQTRQYSLSEATLFTWLKYKSKNYNTRQRYVSSESSQISALWGYSHQKYINS